MEIITVDWETYYTKDYSLTKLTTEEYIRSPMFEAIMLGMRMPDGTHRVIEGTHDEIQYQLDGIEWGRYAVLAHNTMFDGAILAWHFRVKPAVWLDTLSMARAMFGLKGNSLALLAKRYSLEDKGTYAVNMMGKRRADMSDAEFDSYKAYCLHDVDLCHELFTLMSAGWYDLESTDLRHPYPIRELEIIDRLIRMYTEPSLLLNQEKLEKHLAGVIQRKEALLNACSVDRDVLMSNPKFADLLQSLGVTPPMKISPTTGKETYAFAKTDSGMKDLLEHPDERVQVLAAARMGVKSTLEETRTTRFIDIAKRGGYFPIPLKYSAARTHRLGGMDKINLQNLPARGKDAKRLKKAVEPPPGHIVINSDSSNIEARMLAWLAEQDDLVNDFANKVDVYSKMASRIYNREINRKRKEVVDGKEIYPDEAEGFVGKTVVLGAGYQTGGLKLQITLKAATPPMDMPLEECNRIIKTYRETYSKIPELWKQGEKAIKAMHDDHGMWLGKEGVLWVDGKKGIRLPNGLYISYPSLHQYDGMMGERPVKKWRYKDETGFQDIYGGKLIENCVQALARIVVMLQLLKVAKRYTVPLTVHDSVVAIAKTEEAEEAKAYIEECMRWVPKWAQGCPINCEAFIGANYGEC